MLGDDLKTAAKRLHRKLCAVYDIDVEYRGLLTVNAAQAMINGVLKPDDIGTVRRKLYRNKLFKSKDVRPQCKEFWKVFHHRTLTYRTAVRVDTKVGVIYWSVSIIRAVV